MTERSRSLQSILAAGAVSVLLAPPSLAQGQRPYEWNDVSRIVAVGDVHGAYDNFVTVLKSAGLVDDKLRWAGGDTHLVQNGDVVDRGPHSRKAMDLLMELEKDAEKARGRVHALIGNHEAMNVVGILDLVSKEEFEAFEDRDSRRRRDATFERYYEGLMASAKELGEEPPNESDAKREFEEKYPLGFLEHRQAFSAEGRYGKWIRGNNVAVKINGIVFSHGDWSEKLSQVGIAEVNRRVRAELAGELPLEEGVTFDSESPLQYRGLAHTTLTRAAQQTEQDRVARILSNLGAESMVVGHTLTSGVIESRFGGMHISIDTGMFEIYRGGHRVALEVEGDARRAIHDLGKVAIPETMNETNFRDYIRAVALVDPENVDVQLKLVEAFNEERRTDEAVAILEKLFERPQYIPFRYRDLMGTYYESRGDSRRARENYLQYIHGLEKLVAASPDNLNLANLLARFCIDKGIELELAERVLRGALQRSPGNSGFLLTQARLHLARSKFRDALAILEGLPRDVGLGYEILYFTGLAYLGLDDKGSARTAFIEAMEAAPDRPEARDELRKLEGIPIPF